MLSRIFAGALALAPAFASPLLTGATCAASTKKPEDVAALPLSQIARLEQERAAAATFAPFAANPDASVRARAALALARLEHTATAPLLKKLLTDADAGVRAVAAFGIGQLDLALDPKSSTHQALRGDVERTLVTQLPKEGDANVRRAIVRALGRVADTAGLDALVAVASSDDALQGEAMRALGVSGARRQSSRTNDAGLADAVARGVARHEAGAAYAAFRQKLRLSDDVQQLGMLAPDVQTRIFLVRAAPSQLDPGALVRLGMKDADWRVRVEALRAAAKRPESAEAIKGLIEETAVALASTKASPEAHVLREACLAFPQTGVGPAQAKPALQKALVTLAPLAEHRAAACTCAVALDVIAPASNSGGSKAIERCSLAEDESYQGRLEVAVWKASRAPAKERVEALGKLLEEDDSKVRMAAAAALAETGPAAWETAASDLVDEDDFGVATTLMELFADDEEAQAILQDSTLYKLVERFGAGDSYEKVEPLVTVAKIARARTTPTGRAIVDELKGHREPRVRDAAAGVLPGDREPGPRASVFPSPLPKDLPLFAMLKTSRGNIRIAFEREAAPATVANFVGLARAKKYDGTPWHRVIGDFVAQGGDPRGDGSGGPGYTINCENSDLEYTRGAVGMATAGKDTGGQQFFLTHSHQPHLDGRYTLFARVTEGLEVMDALQPDDVLLGIDIAGAAPPVGKP